MSRWSTALARLTGRMSAADRAAWFDAQNLDMLGELTAQWLEGRIESHPAYAAGHGPEPETADLIGTLARLNRAGLVTTCSQPGRTTDTLRQRAAVEGFATPAALRTYLEPIENHSRFAIVITPQAPRWFRPAGTPMVVTTTGGRPFTQFGSPMSTRDIHFSYEPCSRPARMDLIRACQFAIVDPEWNRNDLWPYLDGLTRAAAWAAQR